jgi:hypothetical protein
VEGVTILGLSPLLTLHVFLGMLLIGPVALKIGCCAIRAVPGPAGWLQQRRVMVKN